MRGRLVLPLVVELAPLDTYETSLDPDGAGPLTTGYDDDFREPVKLPPEAGEGAGRTNRKERAPVRFAAQVEMGTADKLQQFFQGEDLSSRLAVVTHFGWLEENGFVTDDGNATFRIGDRLVRVWSKDESTTVFTPRKPLFLVESQPAGLGLGGQRNLLVLFFESRDQGVAS